MVGSEEHEVFALADGLVEIAEEIGESPVEVHELRLYDLVVCAVFVPNLVGGREADAYHVGLALLSELLVCDGVLCHFYCHFVACGRIADLVAGIFAHGLVVFLHPRRQLLHVVGARNEAALVAVNPVGGIGGMSCRKDCGTVLDGYANHARLEVGGHL